MWGQDWSSLINLFIPNQGIVDINKNLKKKSWTVRDMVSLLLRDISPNLLSLIQVAEAEDFYVSLGLPRMSEKFWEMSVFEENENTSMCHGTAANMYSKGDFR